MQAMALAQLRESLDNYGCHTAKSQLDDKLTDGTIARLATTSTPFQKVRCLHGHAMTDEHSVARNCSAGCQEETQKQFSI